MTTKPPVYQHQNSISEIIFLRNKYLYKLIFPTATSPQKIRLNAPTENFKFTAQKCPLEGKVEEKLLRNLPMTMPTQ